MTILQRKNSVNILMPKKFNCLTTLQSFWSNCLHTTIGTANRRLNYKASNASDIIIWSLCPLRYVLCSDTHTHTHVRTHTQNTQFTPFSYRSRNYGVKDKMILLIITPNFLLENWFRCPNSQRKNHSPEDKTECSLRWK